MISKINRLLVVWSNVTGIFRFFTCGRSLIFIHVSTRIDSAIHEYSNMAFSGGKIIRKKSHSRLLILFYFHEDTGRLGM